VLSNKDPSVNGGKKNMARKFLSETDVSSAGSAMVRVTSLKIKTLG